MSVVRSLVAEIVDYAGLFPPASLPLATVVDNYAKYLQSDRSWILARLILPVGKLDELQKQASFQTSPTKWSVSALVPAGEAFPEALEAIDRFNQRFKAATDSGAIVDAIEVKVSNVDEIDSIASQVWPDLNSFLEIPHDRDPTTLVKRIAEADDNVFAKIRTGGVTGDLIPNAADVARFISVCASNKTGFKATAGLHHPLRGRYRLTYDDDPECGTMFGFLNMFIAASLAYSQDVSSEILESVLTESDATAFEIADDRIDWHEFSIFEGPIADIRKKYAISFGSCSFDEPTTELADMGWLDDKHIAGQRSD